MVDSADRLGYSWAIGPPGPVGVRLNHAGVHWPQHLAVMQNVTIYFRNNPSVTFYEGCNGSLTQAADR